MKLKFIRRIALGLGLCLSLGLVKPVSARGFGFVGEYAQGEILSFGSSLNDKQEKALRDYFKVSDDVKAIYIDTKMAVEQLGLDKSMLTDYKGGWYSSAYVKLTNGTGIKVTANNLTLVTDDMLANALITSGILNADVIAAAPFKVSGESALAGILAGAEEIMGEELSQENKETAQKEIETTLEVADEIGQKEASTIMNEIKAEVIKDSPINITQVENIVINVTNNYGIELSDKARKKVVDTMSDINDLDIDYKEVKSTLKEVGNKLFDDLKTALDKGEEIGMKIKESGIFEKIWDGIVNIWNSICDFVRNLFIKDESADVIEEVVTEGGITSDDKDMVDEPTEDEKEEQSDEGIVDTTENNDDSLIEEKPVGDTSTNETELEVDDDSENSNDKGEETVSEIQEDELIGTDNHDLDSVGE